MKITNNTLIAITKPRNINDLDTVIYTHIFFWEKLVIVVAPPNHQFLPPPPLPHHNRQFYPKQDEGRASQDRKERIGLPGAGFCIIRI